MFGIILLVQNEYRMSTKWVSNSFSLENKRIQYYSSFSTGKPNCRILLGAGRVPNRNFLEGSHSQLSRDQCGNIKLWPIETEIKSRKLKGCENVWPGDFHFLQNTSWRAAGWMIFVNYQLLIIQMTPGNVHARQTLLWWILRFQPTNSPEFEILELHVSCSVTSQKMQLSFYSLNPSRISSFFRGHFLLFTECKVKWWVDDILRQLIINKTKQKFLGEIKKNKCDYF